MRTIICSCDATFEEDVPDSIDIDASVDLKRSLLDGSFMTFTCPSCGRSLKPEFPLSVRWPSKGLTFSVIPELERPRLEDLQTPSDTDILFGYAELADRVSVIDADLDPVSVEALKYFLLLKATEADPDAEPTAWFHGLAGDTLEFHIHGLRPNEVAVSRIPRSLYERTLSEKASHPDSEPFCLISVGRYTSVQNLFKPSAD